MFEGSMFGASMFVGSMIEGSTNEGSTSEGSITYERGHACVYVCVVCDACAVWTRAV